MELNKLLPATLLILIPVITSAQVTETQVDFSGNVNTNTCTISSSHSEVDLGELSLNSLKSNPFTTSQIAYPKFTLTIDNCDNTNEPILSLANSFFKNEVIENGATGYSIRLSPIDPKTRKIDYRNTLDNGIRLTNNQNMDTTRILEIVVANVIGEVTVGNFRTVATFIVNYK